ncbi:MAG TPA: alpha/beta hydrolase family protein [Anaerolineae bacterium]|nr:alpha/beta hydrolase family protein [Anaerolineae bacterium]
MALFHCHFFSQALRLSVSVDVILPESRRLLDGILLTPPRPYAVLYLLHGLSDDHTIWQRRTSIERYAADYDLAVIMPAVDRSFYTDMAQGNRYWTYVSEELPTLMRGWFPLSEAREETFVAGLSMGGYGAFKLALSHPERFAAAASFSGLLDVAASFFPELPKAYDAMASLSDAAAETAQRAREQQQAWRDEAQRIFGPLERFPDSPHDLFHLARDVAASPWREQLRLYQWCGTEDHLYNGNLRFRDHAQSLGLNLTYAEGPGGHTWDKWDEQIQKTLAWLPLRRLEG